MTEPNSAHPRAFPSSSGGGRTIAMNTVWTLGGLVLPGVVALLALPMLVHGYGVERFAVLTLVWMVIGYFSVFDLGIGRAVTNRVAMLLQARDVARLRRLVWTGWYLAALVGIAGGAIAAVATPALLDHVVKVPPALRAETRYVFLLLAAGVPLIVFTAATRGVLEAAQRFGMVNAVRVPVGLLTFLIPLACLQRTPSLVPVVIGLLLVRVAALAAYASMCLWLVPELRARDAFAREDARSLFSFGAWVTVSNVISPLMTSADRFVVSAVISLAAVTFYATPLEAVSKVLLIPSAIAAVLFPAFSAYGAGVPARASRLFRLALRALVLLEIPLAFVVICFAPEILGAWLGAPFAAQSAGVMRWLMFGVLANSAAQIAFALLQGLGRSDLTARVHVLEAPAYGVALWGLLQLYGITGAAMAWFARTMVDSVVLIWLVSRETGLGWRRFLPEGVAPVVLVGMTIASAFVSGTGSRVVLSVAFIAAYAVAAWTWGLRGRAGLTAALDAWRRPALP